MRLFPSERELDHQHWRYFGRPFLVMFGVAALLGLVIGAFWVIAGLLNFHVLR
jgi:hypothetical protein